MSPEIVKREKPMRSACLVAICMMAAPVLAQDRMQEVHDDVLLPKFGIIADLADDLDVLDSTGREIGEVEEVVGMNRDLAEALVVDFEDELPEFGREERVVPLTAFRFDGGAFVLREGTDVLALPIWRD
jgi:hypothetical protein